MAIWRIPLRAGAEGENVEKRESLRQKDRIPNEFESVCFFADRSFYFGQEQPKWQSGTRGEGKQTFSRRGFSPQKSNL